MPEYAKGAGWELRPGETFPSPPPGRTAGWQGGRGRGAARDARDLHGGQGWGEVEGREREEWEREQEDGTRYDSGFDPSVPAEHRRAPGVQGPGPEELSNKMEELGNAWADAHAHSMYLEEIKVSVLAEITLDIMDNHPGAEGKAPSKTAAEARARCSVQYKDHLEKMVEAKRRANKARVAYDSFKEKVGLIRTWEANKRAEMKM